jgi:hypothetical protein
MSFEAFNSVGGYSVGIPPTPVITEAGIGTFTGLQLTGIVNLGSVSNVRISGGINGYFLQTDGTGSLSWAPGGNGGGGGNGVPGGSNTQVQFNNDGNFGGDAGFTYDSITNQLSVSGNIVATNFVTTGNVSATTVAATGNISGVNFSATGNISGGNLSVTKITSTGNISAGNANLGNYVAANFYAGNGYLLSGVTALTANYANFAGNVTIASQPNITSLGTLANLTVNGRTSLGSISNVKITGGLNGYVLQTDGTGNLSWTAGGGGGNGTPGGSNTQIQFNNAGTFGGTANLTYNSSNNTVNMSGNLVANTFQLGSGSYAFCKSLVYFATTASMSPNQILWSTPVANLSSVDFTIIGTDTIGVARQTTKISAIIYNGVVVFNEYAGLQINGGVGSFSVVYNSGPATIQLLVTPDTSNQTSYKMLIVEYSD